MSTTATSTLKGGEWLIKESNPFDTFIPEDFNEEQQMVKDMCAAFSGYRSAASDRPH
jgi:hypothetical protein